MNLTIVELDMEYVALYHLHLVICIIDNSISLCLLSEVGSIIYIGNPPSCFSIKILFSFVDCKDSSFQPLLQAFSRF